MVDSHGQEMKRIEPNAARKQTVRVLMQEIVDYAGIFPPAQLELTEVVKNYAAYLAGEDAWMLGRLIIPAARLDRFEELVGDVLPRGEEDDPWRISSLVAGGDDAPSLKRDLARIEAFNQEHANAGAGRAVIDVIELKGGAVAAIDAAMDIMPDEVFPYFELPVDHDVRGLTAALAGGDCGAKIRTGGVTADLYPTPEQVARFISACALADVPFKVTAGLHHPLRYHSEAVGADEFGFLNVFIAAALAQPHELGAKQIEPILTERELEKFQIDGDGVGWGEYRATLEELEDARLTFAVSFGSCSFDEPREDLRALGLL